MVAVWDTELSDFLDDYFTDKDLDPQVAFPCEPFTSYRFYFGSEITHAAILTLLQQLDLTEVDRIYLLNNSQPTGSARDA